jgi:plasmid stabilization system protein ParE
MTVEVIYSPRGAQDAVACAVWWIEHHPEKPNAFDDELTKTVALIKQFPEAAPRGQIKKYKTGRVRVMAETGHLVVYRIKKKSLVEIAAVLASRKTGTTP